MSLFNMAWVQIGLINLVVLVASRSNIASETYRLSSSNENGEEYLPQKENILEKSYHGLIRENETRVEITPLIKVDEEKICNLRIIEKPYHDIPFQIELANNLGILKARRVLNCEIRKSYHFEIMAIYCDDTPSNTANVHITIIDVNEYAPSFAQPSYVTEVDEGRLYNEIINVEATDKDCTPLFGDVCKYEILNNDQPFTIDNEGSIKNTEPLSHKDSRNHILSVVAYDCAMKESEPIMVSIKVRRVCEAKFLGIPERIDYTSVSTDSLQLFPNARLDLCDIDCNSDDLHIHVSIALKTKHISFGCDRDINNCSATQNLKDLLPRGAEWTKQLNYDEGDEPVFNFDGSSGVVVSDMDMSRYDFSVHPFSIATIFRHGSQRSGSKHMKEHIMCSADDHKMNRHHMALFVRNCRLILLLRKNFNEGDVNIFSPAEWRWKIPQVCDNEWHRYVLNVDQSAKVELYIDGALFESSMEDRHTNPEVIDDWPLHAAHGVNTTLTIGACFQSSENRLKHGFNGDISEVKMSMNGLLSMEDIRCGTTCAEHLMLLPPQAMSESDAQVQLNTQMNEIYLEAQSKHNIEMLMRKVQYINTKQKPTIGRRNIELRTTITCSNQSSIRMPTIETYVMVNEPIATMTLANVSSEHTDKSKILPGMNNNNNNEYMESILLSVSKPPLDSAQQKLTTSQDVNVEINKIEISGTGNKLVSYQEIKSGVHILDQIHIKIALDIDDSIGQFNLDYCSVVVFPSLNPDHEEIQIDGDLYPNLSTSSMNIKTNINKDGVELQGNDAIVNYINILRALLYSNKKPAYYLNRVFKLSCAHGDLQFKSAEYTLTLTVLHPKQILSKNSNTIQMASSAGNSYHMNAGLAIDQGADSKVYSSVMVHNNAVEEPKSHLNFITHRAESAHPTMLMGLICVFLVILICGVSIARIKNNQKFSDRHQPCPKIVDEGLIWDDSALTITINPMQADAASENSSDSENSDSEDEEIVKDGFAHINQLEWDNTNMFSTTN